MLRYYGNVPSKISAPLSTFGLKMDIISVAKKAGVSKSTVSRVINNAGGVRESTRLKVLTVMEEMGFQPNIFAQAMKTNQSRTIAVLIPDYLNPFFAAWLAAIEEILRPQNYMTMVCSSGPDEQTEISSLHHLLSRRVDGLIFHSYNRHEKTIQLLESISSRVPVVLLDQIMKHPAISSVLVNGYSGTMTAVQHLILKGRKRIAYVKAKHQATDDRLAGYKQALHQAKMESEEQYIYAGDFSMESGHTAGEYFLGLDQMPDAIVCATDTMALGVLKCLLKNNIAIPDQVAVIGFDNLAITTMIEPALSTVGLPITQMGQKAAQILLTRIATPSSPPTHITMDCELILRESTP